MREAEVVIHIDGAEVMTHPLRPGEYVLGRGAEADVRIDAELVAPRHARLLVGAEHSLIEDLGSEHGTFVNGRPVTGVTGLSPGQQIRIGTATVSLRHPTSLPSPELTLPTAVAALARLLPEELLHERRYQISGQVACGGMGAILEARESAIDRQVAMKMMLNPSRTDDLARFVAEAKITGQLEHPNIVPVHELGVDGGGQVFYTMKFVRGTTLRQVLDPLAAGDPEAVAKYPLAVLLIVFQKACDAVAFAHNRRVIHRDLKPDNIMLGDFGEVLVMDWGLAKSIGEPPAQDAAPQTPRPVMVPDTDGRTLAGTIMGTPHYMSPEQARGEVATLDERTDIWALGAILYHLLALRPPVGGRDIAGMVEKVQRGEVDDLTSGPRVLPHLPGGRIPDSLAAVVRKAMAPRKEDRYPGVPELQAEIAAYQAGFATAAENAGLAKQALLLVKRHKGVFATAAAAWALVTALALWFVVNVTRERNRAERGETAAVEALGLSQQRLLAFKIQKARDAFERGEAGDGLAWLAAVLRQDPESRFAGAWIVSALSHHDFALPAAPPIRFPPKDDPNSENWTVKLGFTPDGRRLVAGSRSHYFGAWDVASSAPVFPPVSIKSEAYPVFSPDGKRIAVWCREDGAPLLFDAATGAAIPHPMRHDEGMRAVAFSSDGRFIATGDRLGKVKVWDGATFALISDAVDAKVEVWRLSFSDDGSHLLVLTCPPLGRGNSLVFEVATGRPAAGPATADQELIRPSWMPGRNALPLDALGSNPFYRWKLVDAAGRSLAAATDGHHGRIVFANFSADGLRLATGSEDSTARLWDPTTGQPLTAPLRHGKAVADAAFGPEGLRLLTVSEDNSCRLWNTLTGAPLCEPIRPAERIETIAAFSPDGARIATASRVDGAQVWDVRAGSELPLVVAQGWWATCADFSPDGALLATGNEQGSAQIWNAGSGEPVSAEIKHDSAVHAVEFSPDGRRLLTRVQDGTVRLWEVPSGRPIGDPFPRNAPAWATAMSPDGRWLAITTQNPHKVEIWDLESRTMVWPAQPLPNPCPSALFSTDGKLLACGTGAGVVVFDAPSGKKLFATNTFHGVNFVAFSPDSSRLAYATYNHGARIIDPRTGRELTPPLAHDNSVAEVDFSPDGTRVLTACDDGRARLWDAATGRLLLDSMTHGSLVRHAAFSPDGRRIVTGEEKSVRLWDTETGEPLTEPIPQGAKVSDVRFSPDGRRIAVATAAKGRTRIYEVPPAPFPAPSWLPELAEAVACRRVDDKGVLTTDGVPDFWTLRTKLSAESADGYYGRWLAWFLADRGTRTISSWSDRTLPAEMDRFLRAGDSVEVFRWVPQYPLLLPNLAKAAREGLIQPGPNQELHAAAILASASRLFLEQNLATLRAAGKEPYTSGAGARGFPRRDPAATQRELDLTHAFTDTLDNNPSAGDSNYLLSTLPKGLVTLDGVRWDIRGMVVLHCQSQTANKPHPVSATGIAVAQPCRRLHFLQASSWKTPDGVRIGRYVLRYADGETCELPIIYGEDLRDWSFRYDPTEAASPREAWRGKPGEDELRLFHRAYDNPRPEVEIATLDFISEKTSAAPFVVAVTVE